MFDTVLIVFAVGTVTAMATTSVNRMIAILVAVLMGYASLVYMLFADYAPRVEMLAITSFFMGGLGLCVELAKLIARVRVTGRTL